MSDPLLLPAGVRLVHIGPHKTGTTALQYALHHARETLHDQGVHYAHPRPQAYKPAIALTGLKGRIGGPQVDDKPWRRLVAEVEAEHDRRVIISSESFSNAGRAHIERLADDLGRDRVHIVRMLRRYDKMLPSQWQQSVAAGGRATFDAFLAKVKSDPRHRFWRRHGFAELTRRWAEVVGVDNVTTVVVDESDREWLLRVMERLVGLRTGTLRAEADRSNRSLTRGEVEVLRRFNQIRKEQGWVDRVHFNYVRLSASPAMRRLAADPDGGRIEVPVELRPMLVEATERDLRALADLGARVVGDTELLRPPPADAPGWRAASTGTPSVAVESAVAAVAGVVARVEEHGTFPLVKRRASDPAPAGDVPRRSLAKLITRLPRREVFVVLPQAPEGQRLQRTFTEAATGGDPDRLPRLVDHLDEVAGRRARVVLVALPPRQLLASRWHEHVVARGGTSFEAWQAAQPLAPLDLPDLLRTAADRWGPRRVSLLVADAFAPHRTDAALAELFGGPQPPTGAAIPARSLLSWSETLVVRRLHEHASEHGWDGPTWHRFVAEGVLPWLLSAPAARLDRGHPLDDTGAGWVVQQSQAMLDAITETGVRVQGDRGLLDRGVEASATSSRVARLRPGTAALALGGVVAAADPRRGR